jgi:microcystin-dependent protein
LDQQVVEWLTATFKLIWGCIMSLPNKAFSHPAPKISHMQFDYSNWEAASGSYQRLGVNFDGSQPYVGEIQTIATNFAPDGWAICDGSHYTIAEYTVLFDLIGTTYGGDGVTTFALPDLRGRVAIHQGNNGTNAYTIGQSGGAASVTLSVNNLPAHNHSLTGSTALLARGDNPGTTATPGSSGYPSISGAANYYGTTESSGPITLMGPLSVNMTIGNTGSGTAVSTMQPFVVVSYIISLYGIFPTAI